MLCHQDDSGDCVATAVQGLIIYHNPYRSRQYLGFRTLGFSKDDVTYSLHRSSFWGSPCRMLNIQLVKPKEGTTMETIGISVDGINPALLVIRNIPEFP